MIEMLLSFAEKAHGAPFGRRAAKKRRQAMLEELRCIYADQKWPRITIQIKLVEKDFSAVDQSDLIRRFEIRAHATFMRTLGPNQVEEIDIPSTVQHVEGLLPAVKAHGHATSGDEYADALCRLRTPTWLIGAYERQGGQ